MRNPIRMHPAVERASSQPRVGLFVDGENLYGTLRVPGRARSLRFESLLAHAASLGRLVHSAVYLGRGADDDRTLPLAIALKHLGFHRVLERKRRRLTDGRQKSACDILIAMDVWQAAVSGEVDAIVLVTGDGDFVPLVERMVDLGIAVHVVGAEHHTAPELLVASTRWTNVDQVPGFVVELEPAEAA